MDFLFSAGKKFEFLNLDFQLNYHCLSVEGYEHHRWRHRDRGSISNLPHHLPLAPIGIGPLSTAPASVATTAEETTRSQGENEEEESEEEEEEEDLAPSSDYSSGSSLGFGLCSRCPPGFGVARRCTLVQDTVCHSCPPSYYAPSYSRRHACWPCSKCGRHFITFIFFSRQYFTSRDIFTPDSNRCEGSWLLIS